MIRRRAPLLAVLALACGSSERDAGGDDFADPFMDEPLPPSCENTSTGDCSETDGAGAPMECAASNECATDQVCAAAFDGDIGRFRCQDSCIATEDAARWCFDAEACCDANATCVRGVCIAPDETSSGG